MKSLGSEKTRLKSRVIIETREREQRLNASYGDDDFFLEADAILAGNNYTVSTNSRYAKLKESYKSNDNNIQLIAHQEALQFLQILRFIGNDEKWRSDILLSFTNDPAIPRKDSRHTPGKDKQFELYLAARFKRAEINIVREEPDLLCDIDGYEFTVAAKRIKSRVQFLKRIKEAGKQIIKAKKPGVIAIDISPLQTMYHSPYQILEHDDFRLAANNFLDIEFESKLNEIRKRTSNNKIIGIIAFSMFCAKHSNNHTNLLGEFHNGSRLCKPNTEKATAMWQIVDRLSN